ncbi:MAG: D-aminoacyl-tRNA deacylase [Fimbriimonadaceae bacterium]|nr:D-aminoacyl-tRNA deacylase [Fimbriimonadaceae bacterium]
MRAVIQRVRRAEVSVDGQTIGAIPAGLMVLVAVHRDDRLDSAAKLARKVATLRILADEAGKMNRSLADLPAEKRHVLAISNFTLYGDARKNRRPSFMLSAPYDAGRAGYEAFVEALRAEGVSVATGEFGADMQVSLVNDGPVTLIMDIEPNDV